MSTSTQTLSKALLLAGIVLASGCGKGYRTQVGPIEKPHPEVLVPVVAVTPEFVHGQIQEFFNYLQANGFLLGRSIEGHPDGYWKPRFLDPDTLEPIPEPIVPPWDLTKELPPDILKGLKKKGTRTNATPRK